MTNTIVGFSLSNVLKRKLVEKFIEMDFSMENFMLVITNDITDVDDDLLQSVFELDPNKYDFSLSDFISVCQDLDFDAEELLADIKVKDCSTPSTQACFPIPAAVNANISIPGAVKSSQMVRQENIVNHIREIDPSYNELFEIIKEVLEKKPQIQTKVRENHYNNLDTIDSMAKTLLDVITSACAEYTNISPGDLEVFYDIFELKDHSDEKIFPETKTN